MKLNNRGWGLNFLIIVGALFILLLVFVSIRIRSVTHQIKEDGKKSNSSNKEYVPDNNEVYILLEQSLKKAGESYSVMVTIPAVLDYHDQFVVKYETLKNSGYIESLRDPSGNGDCEGYVLIKVDDGNNSVDPYIKCEKYKTLNYDLWVD